MIVIQPLMAANFPNSLLNLRSNVKEVNVGDALYDPGKPKPIVDENGLVVMPKTEEELIEEARLLEEESKLQEEMDAKGGKKGKKKVQTHNSSSEDESDLLNKEQEIAKAAMKEKEAKAKAKEKEEKLKAAKKK
jgi:hypothetical protein